uniref:NADH-ubiquinone oxidoreductase chain 3 n=1 Tax=Ligia oceanica TaxID=96856 RepID=Q09TE5_LIGOC|nr:NADH dehydrogenase subunit 3 [Ligia oceanica]
MLFMAYSTIALLLGAILLLASMVLGRKEGLDREKASPFECGFDPVGSGRVAFSVRFFLVAIIFLVFDVEISLLLPVVIGLPASLMGTWAILGGGFLLVLLVGTLHEWREGSLDWKG